MKSVIVTPSATERHDGMSIAACVAEAIAVVPGMQSAEPTVEVQDELITEKTKGDMNAAELLVDADALLDVDIVEAGERKQEPAVVEEESGSADVTGEPSDYRSPFDMWSSTIENFKGTEDISENDLLTIVCLAGTHRAQAKINQMLENVGPFKPLAHPEITDEITKARQCVIDNNMEEFNQRLEALVDKSAEEMVNIAVPVPFKPEDQLETPEDHQKELLKGVVAQIRQMRMGNRYVQLGNMLRDTVTLIKEDQRVPVLTEAKLLHFIPEMDQRMLAAKSMMENPAFAKLMQGGGEESSEGVDNEIFLSSSDDADVPATPMVGEASIDQAVTPKVEEATMEVLKAVEAAAAA